MRVARVPARAHRVEASLANSRFIASLAPAFTVEEARGFIGRIRHEFADATHNVPAYLIGHGPSVIEHCSDDGEPSGTAGPPALAVLRGSGLGDVVVVVTRYFGGTKLGTGGLVRAYGDAVREVLKHVPVAEKVRASLFCMTIPYSLYERVEHLASKLGAEITEESFGAQVDLEMRVRSSRATELRRSLAQLSAGEVEPELIEEGLALVAVSGAGSWEEGWRAEGGSGG